MGLLLMCRALFLTLMLSFSMVSSLTSDAAESNAATNTKRRRVIVTSDFPPFPVTNSDPDDVQSMVRFLLYASDSRAWVEENIIKNHGPLCAIYPPRAVAGQGVMEGDSPAFLYLISANRGINDPEDPTQPSWGGQYVRQGSTKHFIDGPGAMSIRKWRADFRAEFKERADWTLP